MKTFSKLHVACVMTVALPGVDCGANFAMAATGKDLAVTKPTMTCADLAKTDLTSIGGAGSSITSAKEETVNNLKMCTVEGVLAPTIKFVVKLPIAAYTQRFMQLGCGGLCGHIGLEVGAADGCAPLTDGGFVISTTDMGHDDDAEVDKNGVFGKNPQKRVDFAYRAEHVTALASKALIKAYYGQAQAYSYFNGCSDGGREAVMEAQRYPDDFNGIIAGAPAMLFQFQNSLHHGWLATQNRDANGKAILLSANLPVLHQAVVKACDKLDGVEDGLLSDPRICKFDLANVQCAVDAADTSACLTAAETDVARKFYEGPHDPVTGQRLIVGGPQYGSELGWAGVFVPYAADDGVMSQMVSEQAMGNLIFENDPATGTALSSLKFDSATVELLKARHPLLDATNPDINAFADAGGKLILWHGWADQHISPITTIAYHEAMQATLGNEKLETFERLYVLPGVQHCGRGDGPSSIDLLSAMMNWVEQGQAPDAIASTSDQSEPSNFGQPNMGPPGGAKKGPPSAAPAPVKTMTRPVFPYPAVATYKGTGDVTDAANYDRGPALYSESVSDWVGPDFFKPYEPGMN
jgi:Tannase and feruloyl esterase